MNSNAAGPGHAVRPVRHKDLPATLYGIRHHGPGSARSVRAALAEQRPDVVLIEGPPEAEAVVNGLRWAGREKALTTEDTEGH